MDCQVCQPLVIISQFVAYDVCRSVSYVFVESRDEYIALSSEVRGSTAIRLSFLSAVCPFSEVRLSIVVCWSVNIIKPFALSASQVTV